MHAVRVGDVLKQVKAPQLLAHVIDTDPDDHEYDIEFRKAPEGGWVWDDPEYDLDESTLVTKWHVEASGSGYNVLTISQLEGGSKEFTYTYAVLSDPEDPLSWSWTLTTTDGGSVTKTETETWATIETAPTQTWERTRVVSIDEDGGETERVTDTLKQHSWGASVSQRDVDNGNGTLTTYFYYEDDTSAPDEPGRLWKQLNPDGSWVVYHYQEDGRMAWETHSWGDLAFPTDADTSVGRSIEYFYWNELQSQSDEIDAGDDGTKFPSRPRKIVERIDDEVVSKQYLAYPDSATRIDKRCTDLSATYATGAGLVTKTVYWDSVSEDRIYKVIYPDNRMDQYDWSDSGTETEMSVEHGIWDNYWGTFELLVGQSTREQITRTLAGNIVVEEHDAYIDSGYWGTTHAQPMERIVRTYDDRGRLAEVTRSDGTHTVTGWGCCSQDSVTDTAGIETTYTYDVLGRLQEQSRLDITTEYDYDCVEQESHAFHKITVTRTGDTLSLVTSQTFDLAGRIVSATDEAGLPTTRSYSTSSGGGQCVTITRPGGATEVTEYYRDGRIKSIWGTAVIKRAYAYGANSDGTQWTRVVTGTDDPDDPDWETLRWTITTYDMVGRVVSEERPAWPSGAVTTSYYYNSLGQLAHVSTPGRADTWYKYDLLGRQTQQGLSLDSVDGLQADGIDRITETITEYRELEDDELWSVTTQAVYAVAESDSPTILSTQRRRLTGNDLAEINRTELVDARNNVTSTTTEIDAEAHTVTERTYHPDTDPEEPEEQMSLGGLLQSHRTKTGLLYTFTYDALGRRETAHDPRMGTGVDTVTHYNSLGQVDYVDDPADNRTTYAYDSTTGRVSVVGRQSGTSSYVYTRFAYTDRGETEKVWGDAPQPVKFEYDEFGQRVALHTYRSDDGID